MAKVKEEKMPDLVIVLVRVRIDKTIANQPAMTDGPYCALVHCTGNHRKLAIIVD